MHEKTRLVFVSGHSFGLHALKGVFASDAYLDGRLEVASIVGLSQRFASTTVGFTSFKEVAHDHAIKHISTTDGRLMSLNAEILACQPHYILVIGWSKLVPDEVINIPRILHSR